MKILQPAKNTAPYPMAQSTEDGPAIQAWVQGRAQEDALNQNTVLATNYLNNTFHVWLYEYESGDIEDGQDPNAPPPQPPKGFIVQVSDDNYTCNLIQEGPPVCSIPSYDKIPAPQTLQQAANMLAVLARGNSQDQAATMAPAPSPFTKDAAIYGAPIAAADGSMWIRVS